jgi:hypothetical protein
MRFISMACAAALLVPALVAAQETASVPEWPLDSGSRVRIQAAAFSGQTQQGIVVSTRADTLHFQPWRGTGSDAVGLNDITRLDILHGTHSHKLAGALIGFALAGGLTAGITAATWKKPSGTGFMPGLDFGRGGDAAFGGLLAGLLGGVVGLLVGTHETETWVPVKLPNRS